MEAKVEKRKRRYHTRSKSGCLTCRARRKRCTEEKPVCLGCQRNSLLCSWPKTSHAKVAGHPTAAPTPTPASRVTAFAVEHHRDELHDALLQQDPIFLFESDLDNSDLDQVLFPSAVSDFSACSESSESSEFADTPTSDARPSPTPTRRRPTQSTGLSLYAKPSIHAGTSLAIPGAFQLFQHWSESTSRLLAARPQPGNPFVSCLLPLAFADDNIMHAVLATSASHRASSCGDDSVYSLARQHYAVALRSAKYQITKFARGSCDQPFMLIALLLTLCQFECVDGNLQGAVVHHLGAAGQILAQIPRPNPGIDATSYAFFLEQIMYMSCVSNNAGLGSCMGRTMSAYLPTFKHLRFLDMAAAHVHDSITGYLVGYSWDLLRLIPQIQWLAILQHQEKPDPAIDTLAAFEAIRAKIEHWSLPDEAEEDATANLRMTALMQQQALYLFLYCAVHGPGKTSALLRFQAEPHVTRCIQLMNATAFDSPGWTVLTWSLLVVGSCARRRDQQENITACMNRMVHRMYAIPSSLKILRWIWDGDMDDAYGPYGIDKISRRHQVRLSVG